MKVGDKIYCHRSIIIHDNMYETISKNRFYEIIKVGDFEFTVYDNNAERHSFSYDRYKTWFLSNIQYRKLKLKKINESNL